jgi:hypothetical protein
MEGLLISRHHVAYDYEMNPFDFSWFVYVVVIDEQGQEDLPRLHALYMKLHEAVEMLE